MIRTSCALSHARSSQRPDAFATSILLQHLTRVPIDADGIPVPPVQGGNYMGACAQTTPVFLFVIGAI